MELAVCHHYRISHSQFLSWSQDNRDKAIWWLVRQGETCPGCGTREEEWDPQHGGGLDAYTATVQLCHGCRELDTLRERLGDDAEAGAQVVLRRGRRGRK